MNRQILVFLGLVITMSVMTVNTQTINSILKPYGGQTVGVVACTWTPGVTKITVGPPRGGEFLDTPATFRFLHGSPALRTGQWQLGIAGNTSPCAIRVCGTLSGCSAFVVGFGNVKLFEGTSR